MAYHYEASIYFSEKMNLDINPDEFCWYDSFEECWRAMEVEDVLIIATENSYAGSIYENFYRFLKYDVKIVGEYNMPINMSLVSNEEKVDDIDKVYAHFKALPQCYDYFNKHWITDQRVHADNAGAAKMVSETKEKWAAAVCSTQAWKLYGLNILEECIQDQKGNTTRFVAVVHKDSKRTCVEKVNKVSIIFEAKNIPASLHKCLGVFAQNDINLSKIESLPNIKTPFSYLFWVDIDWSLESEGVKKSLEELKEFTEVIKVIWSY